MAYTPTTWTNGDTITAAGLNKMEQGIANAGGVFVVNVNGGGGSYYCDKTATEIFSAAQSSIVLFKQGSNIELCLSAAMDSYGYYFDTNGHTYAADSGDGYPFYSEK